MPETTTTPDHADVRIRLAEEADHPAILVLFERSAVEGHLRENDTGADIENLREGYFDDDGQSAFFVAVDGDEVVGMIGVQKTKDETAEMRRLRVREDHRRRGIGTKLMETAIDFCRRQGYLKVILDVRIERGPARALFEKFGFTHARTREIDNRQTLDFYLDLYRETNG